jgi:hypothetical protein
MHTRVLPIAGVVTAVALAGCAGHPTTQKIEPAFIAKVNALCTTINDQVHAAGIGTFPYQTFDPQHPDTATLPLVGAYFARGLLIRRAIPADLAALGEPRTAQAQWDSLRNLALQLNQTAIEQVAAAKAGDKKAFVATVNRVNGLHDRISSKALEDGFAKSSPCGDTF